MSTHGRKPSQIKTPEVLGSTAFLHRLGPLWGRAESTPRCWVCKYWMQSPSCPSQPPRVPWPLIVSTDFNDLLRDPNNVYCCQLLCQISFSFLCSEGDQPCCGMIGEAAVHRGEAAHTRSHKQQVGDLGFDLFFTEGHCFQCTNLA